MSEVVEAIIFCVDLYLFFFFFFACEKLRITTPLHFPNMPFCLSGYLIKIESSLGVEVDSLKVARPRV